MTVTTNRREAPEALILFGLIAILVGADVVADALAGTTLLHLLAEIAATALALAGVALLGGEWRPFGAKRRLSAPTWRRRARRRSVGAARPGTCFRGWPRPSTVSSNAGTSHPRSAS